MRIEMLSVPQCPNVAHAREVLRTCLDGLGIRAEIIERVGDYPSPTILINGIDVMGAPPTTSALCRLDLPTRDKVLAALRMADN